MNGRLWIKRAIATVLALGAIGYAWHVYQEQFTRPQSPPAKANKASQAAPLRAPKVSPATRPTTNLASKNLLAVAKADDEEDDEKEPGEAEGRDLSRPYKPNDPFRIARANRHIDGPRDTVRSVALSRDKSKLVAGGNDRIVRLFDFASGKELRRFEGHTAFVLGVNISPDGSRIISCGADKTVRVWDVKTGEQLAEMEHQDEATAVAFLAEPDQAVSASADGTARFWDLQKEASIKKIDYGRRVCAMAVCLPANLLALGTHGGEVYLWDLKTRTQIRQLETAPGCIEALMFSGDGKRLMIIPAMKQSRVVEVATAKIIFEEPQDQWDRTWSGAISADGNLLALGRGFQVIFYDLQTFKRCDTYLNPNAFTQAMTFVPDSPQLIIGGGGMLTKDGEWMRPWDDTILIFNLPQPLP